MKQNSMGMGNIIIGLGVGGIVFLYILGSIIASMQGLKWLFQYIKSILF